MLHVLIQRDFENWRRAARSLLVRDVEPSDIFWDDGSASGGGGGGMPSLLMGETFVADGPAAEQPNEYPPSSRTVPAAFFDLARLVACHRNSDRWSLLYRIAWRLTHGERRLLDITVDDDVSRLVAMRNAVRRDRHKMTAFVRFRRIEVAPAAGDDDQPAEHYVAWHRPDHYIVRLATPFFVRRFATMRWSILTPDDSVFWDGKEVSFGAGVPASQAPPGDALDELWRTYYANIFNPARLNLRAMKRELPVRHWKTLPETQILPDLIKDAPRRVEEMVAKQRRLSRATTKAPPGKSAAERLPAHATTDANCPTATSAAEFVPASHELPVLAKAAAKCQGCRLYCSATQVVFGEGPKNATVMFVGEQPGDQEDRAGKPFVGPAGQLLDEMMQRAGIPRDEVYVTNAVKHFKFEQRGIRRIHSKPSAREVSACRPWLQAEIETVKPDMIVCLGATAAQSLMGSGFRVTQQRGEAITDTKWAPWVMATYHPSALLRVPDDEMREKLHGEFLQDMKTVAKQMKRAIARASR
jgi:DNA polymerase